MIQASEKVPGRGPPGRGPPPRVITPFINTREENLVLLFQWFHISSLGSFIAALVVIFIFSVILTVISLILQQYESEMLQKHNKLTVKERLLGSMAFVFRMIFLYLAVLIAVIRNFWFLCMLLLGHFVGWVIFSSDTIATPILGTSEDQGRPSNDGKNDDNSSMDSVWETFFKAFLFFFSFQCYPGITRFDITKNTHCKCSAVPPAFF